jgi:hypothetical protein
LSDISPVEVTVTPVGTVARVVTFAIVIETAAATLIPPPEVEADGVVPVPLEPFPGPAAESA